jgi:hypothetical protein
MEELQYFIQYRALKSSSCSLTLNSTDSEFLQSLLTRPSIVTSRRKEKIRKNKINFPSIID